MANMPEGGFNMDRKVLVFTKDPWYKWLATYTAVGCYMAVMIMLPWLIARIIMGSILLGIVTLGLFFVYGSLNDLEYREIVGFGGIHYKGYMRKE